MRRPSPRSPSESSSVRAASTYCAERAVEPRRRRRRLAVQFAEPRDSSQFAYVLRVSGTNRPPPPKTSTLCDSCKNGVPGRITREMGPKLQVSSAGKLQQHGLVIGGSRLQIRRHAECARREIFGHANEVAAELAVLPLHLVVDAGSRRMRDTGIRDRPRIDIARRATGKRLLQPRMN